MDDLTNCYQSVERFGKQLNDPNNIMGDVLDELRKFNAAFSPDNELESFEPSQGQGDRIAARDYPEHARSKHHRE